MESDADLTGGSLAGWLRFSTLAADLIADFCLVVAVKNRRLTAWSAIGSRPVPAVLKGRPDHVLQGADRTARAWPPIQNSDVTILTYSSGAGGQTGARSPVWQGRQIGHHARAISLGEAPFSPI